MHRFSRWKVHLSDAQSPAQVAELMAAYLRTLTPHDIEMLPASCWDALDVKDIAGSAVVLLREELHYRGDGEAAQMLHEIAHTFIAAATRIAAIQAKSEPVSTGD